MSESKQDGLDLAARACALLSARLTGDDDERRYGANCAYWVTQHLRGGATPEEAVSRVLDRPEPMTEAEADAAARRAAGT